MRPRFRNTGISVKLRHWILCTHSTFFLRRMWTVAKVVKRIALIISTSILHIKCLSKIMFRRFTWLTKGIIPPCFLRKSPRILNLLDKEMICVPSVLMLVFVTSHDELTEVLPVFFGDVLHIQKGRRQREREQHLDLAGGGKAMQYSTEWKKVGAGWNRLVLLLAFFWSYLA